MTAKRLRLFVAVVSSGIVLAALLLVLSLHSSAVRAERPVPESAIARRVSPGTALGTVLQLPIGTLAVDGAPRAVALPNACSAPIVESGSIVTGTSPVYTGRLIRNGVPAVCGQDFTCSGVQSTSSKFSYQSFNFINPSPDWQCVHVTLDAYGCGEQVYSAAYLNPFDPADLCSNVVGEMGFSTAKVYGYSFMVPPGADFTVVNNTTGIVPPSSNCASYVMTTTLCTTELAVSAIKRPSVDVTTADSAGRAIVPVDIILHNSGPYSTTVDAAAVSETVSIEVLDGSPAAAQATFGHAGAILPPGRTVSQTVMLEFTGSQFTCLPRRYRVTSQLDMVAGVYDCNGFSPPSAEAYAGSLMPNDNLDEDSIAFQSLPGTYITATVDTVSAATAFDIEACISGTPQGQCLPGFGGDDDFTCTYPPPSFGCPRFGGLLPADPDHDNIYYLRINSGSGVSNFAGPVGEYEATLEITSGPTGMCPVVLVLDNGTNSFLAVEGAAMQAGTDARALNAGPGSLESDLDAVLAPGGAAGQPVVMQSPLLTTTFSAQVLPIDIIVPASNPGAPNCGHAFLPVTLRQSPTP